MKLAIAGVVLGADCVFCVDADDEEFVVRCERYRSMTFGSITLLLAVVALLACWIPARRATKVDPIVRAQVRVSLRSGLMFGMLGKNLTLIRDVRG